MIEPISEEELQESFSTPFAIAGASTFGWRLTVRCLQPVPWVPNALNSKPVTSAIIRFSNNSKLIISTRSSKALNETTHLHFEARQFATADQAKKDVDTFRRRLILLDAMNHLGLTISPSDDGLIASPEDPRPQLSRSQIDQLAGGASDAFVFPESVGVKGVCSDFELDGPRIDTTGLHSALDAIVKDSVDIRDQFSSSIDLLRSAGREQNLRSRFLLTFGAFEALCSIQERPEKDRQLLHRLDALVQEAALPVERKSSLRSALAQLKKQPLREAMLSRIMAVSPRSGVDKDTAPALIKRAVELRNRIAHPSHPKLPDDVEEIANQLHILIIRLILSESNEQAYDIPIVGNEYDYRNLKGGLVWPLNAAKVWYSH